MANPPLNIRARAPLAGHARVSWQQVEQGEPVTNIVIDAETPAHPWISEATAKIGDWRAFTRSVYLRWAITINACEVAGDRYRSLGPGVGLETKTLRVEQGNLTQQVLAIWPGPEAAEKYDQTMPLIASYGLADIYGAFDDVIFELYEVVLRHNPSSLIRGDEFRDLRRLWNARGTSAEAAAAWGQAWKARFDAWRRKRGYDGLHQVFAALMMHAQLKRPSGYQHTDIPDWCRTLEMIGELRNLIVHGAATVSEKLSALSNTPTSLTFDFSEGEILQVKLHHLQSAECFFDQLLSALNLSMVELAVPRADKAGT